jgi:hypothetical protein
MTTTQALCPNCNMALAATAKLCRCGHVLIDQVRQPTSELGTDSSGPAGRYVSLTDPLEYGSGTALTADGGTIAHGLGAIPTSATVEASVAGEVAYITAMDATNLTVAVKNATTMAAGTTQPVSWTAVNVLAA